MKLQLAGMLPDSLVNGEGLRTVVFVSGCSHNCRGCHNKDMQSKSYGDSIEVSKVYYDIEKNSIARGVTFSGGEPFDQAEALCELASLVKANGKSLWCYTGYVLEELKKSSNPHVHKLLSYVDVLVDGPFLEELMEGAPRYAGSSNQRVLKLK